MSEAEQLQSRIEASARVPAEQRFQMRIVPSPGRLFFASTIGNSLTALGEMFKGIHQGGEVVCLLDAKFDEEGAFVMDIAVLPIDHPEAA
jgi:hypothetical protein